MTNVRKMGNGCANEGARLQAVDGQAAGQAPHAHWHAAFIPRLCCLYTCTRSAARGVERSPVSRVRHGVHEDAVCTAFRAAHSCRGASRTILVPRCIKLRPAPTQEACLCYS